MSGADRIGLLEDLGEEEPGMDGHQRQKGGGPCGSGDEDCRSLQDTELHMHCTDVGMAGEIHTTEDRESTLRSGMVTLVPDEMRRVAGSASRGWTEAKCENARMRGCSDLQGEIHWRDGGRSEG